MNEMLQINVHDIQNMLITRVSVIFQPVNVMSNKVFAQPKLIKIKLHLMSILTNDEENYFSVLSRLFGF